MMLMQRLVANGSLSLALHELAALATLYLHMGLTEYQHKEMLARGLDLLD